MPISTQLVKGSAIIQEREVTNPIKGSVEGPAERRRADHRKKSQSALPALFHENTARDM